MAEAAATLRGLAHDLRDASDSVILRVTLAIDTLAERGAADRLLDGLRPRLGALRPPRPHALSRVLFTPLDPVIVATGAWRPGNPSIPRSLIAPVTALVRARLPDADEIEARLAAGSEADPRLWKQAADILGDGPLPEQWGLPAFQAETGIKPNLLPPLIGVIRLVFAHIDVLRQPDCEHELTADMIRPLLLEAARSGPLNWGVVLGLLFEHTSAPAALLEHVLALTRTTGVARQLEGSLQGVIGTVIDKLDRAMPPSASVTDEALDAQARRATRLHGFGALHSDVLLGGLVTGGLGPRKRQLAAECAAQLVSGLSGATEACVPAGPLGPEEQQLSAERLEARLRALRRLDLAARPLGDAEGREQVLAEAAAYYAGDDAPEWLTRADRLRLCEILVGAEAALRLEQDQTGEAALVQQGNRHRCGDA